MARVLIAFRAHVNVTDNFGRTPLMHAALQAHPACVRVLLEAGADPDVQDEYLHTAVMACFYRFSVGYWDLDLIDFAMRNR